MLTFVNLYDVMFVCTHMVLSEFPFNTGLFLVSSNSLRAHTHVYVCARTHTHAHTHVYCHIPHAKGTSRNEIMPTQTLGLNSEAIKSSNLKLFNPT